MVHLIVSRTATGSSCRFVAAFALAFLQLTQSSLRHRAASGLLGDNDGSFTMGSTWGSRGSFANTASLPSSPLGSPRRWFGLGSQKNVSSFSSLDSSIGQDDDGLSVERFGFLLTLADQYLDVWRKAEMVVTLVPRAAVTDACCWLAVDVRNVLQQPR